MYGSKERALTSKYQFNSTLTMITILVVYTVLQILKGELISFSSFIYVFMYLVLIPFKYLLLRHLSKEVNFKENILHNSIVITGILVFLVSIVISLLKFVFDYSFETMIVDILNVIVWFGFWGLLKIKTK